MHYENELKDLNCGKRYLKLCVIFLMLCTLLSAAPPPWLDLPADDYTKILQCHTFRSGQLNESIRIYTDLPKSYLRERIQALDRVIDVLQIWIQEESKTYLQERLQELKVIASNKRWYLEQLLGSYEHGKFEESYLIKNLCTLFPLKEGRKALLMLNERRYHTKYGEYWGEYWLEAMDPCHRQLMTYRDRWLKEKEVQANIPPFFIWLEDQNLSKDVPYLVYLSEQELLQAQVTAKNMLLHFVASNQLVGFDQETEYLFIIDLQERLILAQGSKLIHHNSLSLSKPVLAAGKIGVHRGKVTMLSFESGHYIPSIEDDVRIVFLLEELGVVLDRTIPVIFYNEGCYKISLGEFLEAFVDKTNCSS